MAQSVVTVAAALSGASRRGGGRLRDPGWLAGHGFPVEAVRHAQAAADWGLAAWLAAWLLADLWPGAHLDGQDAAIHELLAGFPAGASATDAELAAVAAAEGCVPGHWPPTLPAPGWPRSGAGSCWRKPCTRLRR